MLSLEQIKIILPIKGKAMGQTIRVSDELAEQVQKMNNPNMFVSEAMRRALKEEEEVRRIKKSLAQADAGIFVSDE